MEPFFFSIYSGAYPEGQVWQPPWALGNRDLIRWRPVRESIFISSKNEPVIEFFLGEGKRDFWWNGAQWKILPQVSPNTWVPLLCNYAFVHLCICASMHWCIGAFVQLCISAIVHLFICDIVNLCIWTSESENDLSP